MAITSQFADIDIPNVDLWNLYLEGKRDYPDDHILLVDGDTGRSYIFAEIKRLSIAFGQGLVHSLDWRKGDVLGFYTPNCVDTPVVNLGLHWAAGIASPANPTYTPDELAHQLKDSGAKALITQRPFLDAALEAAKAAGIPRQRVLLMGDARDDKGEFKHWTEVTAEGAWLKPRKPQVDPAVDTAYLVYSSGTTGLPKGVSLTHRNLVANAMQSYKIDTRSLNWDVDAQLGVLPFFHIYGLSVVLNVAFVAGAKCVIMARWDLEKACNLIQSHRITVAYVAPPIILALGKQPAVAKYDLSTIKWINSGAAPLGPELAEAVWNRLKVGVKQGYGLSETSPTIMAQFADEWSRFQGSVGKLLPNMVARIVDTDGKDLPNGEHGELLVKGPNVFAGYWNRPDLQADTFTSDGWFKTGDVAYVDEHGNFFITDRIKELIKYKGFQVAPAELEDKLLGNENVADVAVIGVWDDALHTEVPRAYIVPTPGVEANEDLAKRISDWLAGEVAPPKKLRGGVRFVDVIPKSPSGKILRRLLKDKAKKEAKEAAGPKAKL
ncbi:unnamed protein product [Clonostachys chloroleuca]|uniref:Uncharacterized protein n=1 Tax=Clonostachys chloroleuca TaxID=1926264 RepID=A0AA35LU96_9HYPO|nr:unnamed protein product [Clonostachys chloroleuca]